MWLYQKLIQICERLGFWQYTLKFISAQSYICNFYDPKTIWYFAHLTSGVGFKVIFAAFSFELTAEGQERIKMMFSYKDN